MVEINKLFVEYAQQIKAKDPTGFILEYPTSFEEFDLASLIANEKVFESLVRCYQQVFGSRDIWGEGAQCNSCGNQISIEEYIQRKGTHDYGCSNCQGKYVQIFPIGYLEKRIKYELDPCLWINPFVILYFEEDSKEVVGFCWGVVDTPGKIADRIIENKYADDSRSSDLIKKQLLAKFDPDELVVFYDEIGIIKTARGGIGPVAFLVRLGLEKGAKNNTKKALYWTSRKSPIYMICKLSGYEDLFDTPDKLIFCHIDDFVPLMEVIQGTSIDEQSSFLARVAKEVLG